MPLRGHNWVLGGGSDRAPGSILGVPPFLVTGVLGVECLINVLTIYMKLLKEVNMQRAT